MILLTVSDGNLIQADLNEKKNEGREYLFGSDYLNFRG